MASKKNKSVKKNLEAKEPDVSYGRKDLRIFSSFAEQEQYELEQMAALSPEQILQQMRKFINTAFGMHGYNPEKLPSKHKIKIVTNQ